MASTLVTANGSNATATIAGDGPPSNLFGAGWAMPQSTSPESAFVDLGVPAGATSMRVSMRGTITPLALGAYHVVAGVQLCNTNALGGGVKLGSHLRWDSGDADASHRLTANVSTPFYLPTWTIHPSDLQFYAGLSVRFFFQATNAAINFQIAQCFIEYTTDARVPWTLSWRTPSGPELGGINAGLGIGPAGGSAATAPFVKLADYHTPGTTLPSTHGYSNQPALTLPPQANADATFYDIVMADVPATTDPAPLLDAGLKFYRHSTTTSSTYLNKTGIADVRIYLFDRAANTIIGQGSRVRDYASLFIPQQMSEIQVRQFRAGRASVVADGVGDDIMPAYAATWTQSLAAGTLSLVVAVLRYTEVAGTPASRATINERVYDTFANLTQGPPPGAAGCTPIRICFGHLCEGDTTIISLAGSIALVSPSPLLRHGDYEPPSAFIVTSRASLTDNGSNCLVSVPIPANSALVPIGSSYALTATADLSNGEKHTYTRQFVMPFYPPGTLPVDIATIAP